jgi:hypothetical protein
MERLRADRKKVTVFAISKIEMTAASIDKKTVVEFSIMILNSNEIF